jgi:hypothetical protein
MHSFPLEGNEDAFYLTGAASHVSHPQVRDRLARQFADECSDSDSAMPPPGEEQHLFEFQSRQPCSRGPAAMAIPNRNTPSGERPSETHKARSIVGPAD